MIPLRDVLRALGTGDPEGGPCRDTDPMQHLAPGLPGARAGPSTDALTAQYRVETAQRCLLMADLDTLCFWHMHLHEIENTAIRSITAARRELHIRLRNAQTLADLEYARTINN